ncbi:hypothetical protein AAFF_G00099060 [Aldrovandia affinis]|uniref:Uncharacterized protein n=1 Tax=Aldrovandia affinis TaxID=143900 RepID=A0AAD7RUV1_9TELE|nr:hypothetical protein AAFF_G00099060 [Aldrovandia affinis]
MTAASGTAQKVAGSHPRRGTADEPSRKEASVPVSQGAPPPRHNGSAAVRQTVISKPPPEGFFMNTEQSIVA